MKKLFTLAMAASFLFSCSGGDSSDPEPVVPSKPTPEKWAINIAMNIARVTDTSFENGDKVGIYVIAENAEDSYAGEYWGKRGQRIVFRKGNNTFLLI